MRGIGAGVEPKKSSEFGWLIILLSCILIFLFVLRSGCGFSLGQHSGFNGEILEGLRDDNTRAQTAGRNARIAEEVYFQNSGGDNGGSYAGNLKSLLIWDKHLNEDGSVTFLFGHCNASGYTFTTRHPQESKAFIVQEH